MAHIPIVTIVGYSDSGKTRCIVELISILAGKGYRVASAKHCHDGFTLDTKGKDTWKQKRAGAVMTLMSSRTGVGIIADNQSELSLEELCSRYAHDADILLAEGYSWEPHPKILVLSNVSTEQERIQSNDQLIAVVGERRSENLTPAFTFAEISDLALLLEMRFLTRLGRSD